MILILVILVALAIPSSLPASENFAVKPSSRECFPGAYYRKAVSNPGYFTGITGEVTLPDFTLSLDNITTAGKPVDNPSVYMGGHAPPTPEDPDGTEIDAGVSWSIIVDENDRVTTDARAYRPYWRNENWHNGPKSVEYYYWPGDRLRMTVECRAMDQLTLRIDLLERGERGKREAAAFSKSDVETTPTYPGQPLSTLMRVMEASGFYPGNRQEFKRVNAIDQRGRENNPVLPTTSQVYEATWHWVDLIRGEDRIVFQASTYSDMRCPDPTMIDVKTLPNGGESITITPGGNLESGS